MSKNVRLLLLNLLLLILTAESACRIKYFLYHDYDMGYLFAPLLWEKTPRLQTDPNSNSACPDDSAVFSRCRNENLAVTYNSYCWRGAEISPQKASGTYRILVAGGSPVESIANGDEDTWVYKLGLLLNRRNPCCGKIETINAGRGGSTSSDILNMLLNKGFDLSPDMLIYYAAFNDSRENSWSIIDTRIGRFSLSKLGFLHDGLFYKSMLYTYLVEKYIFWDSNRNSRIMKREMISPAFKEIISECESRGIQFVYVREVIDFPLEANGVDLAENEETIWKTLNEAWQRRTAPATSGAVTYDELYAYRQRLRNTLQTKFCKEKSIPVIDPFKAFENRRKLKEQPLFLDLVHLNCFGNELLAEEISGPLYQYLETGKSSGISISSDSAASRQ